MEWRHRPRLPGVGRGADRPRLPSGVRVQRRPQLGAPCSFPLPPRVGSAGPVDHHRPPRLGLLGAVHASRHPADRSPHGRPRGCSGRCRLHPRRHLRHRRLRFHPRERWPGPDGTSGSLWHREQSWPRPSDSPAQTFEASSPPSRPPRSSCTGWTTPTRTSAAAETWPPASAGRSSSSWRAPTTWRGQEINRRSSRPSPSSWTSGPVQGQRDQHRRRWLLRDLRRAGASGPLRPGHAGCRCVPRDRGTGRRPHR